MTITSARRRRCPRWTTLCTETSLSPEHLGDLGEHARPVGDLEVQVEGRARRRVTISSCRASPRTAARRRRASRRRRRAPPRRSASPPAPGPDIVISVIAGDSTMTALNGPSIGASGWPRVEEAGEDADADPAVAALGDAEQLQREAELLRVGEVVGLDLARCPRRGRRRARPACRRRAGRGSPSSPRRRRRSTSSVGSASA